MRTIQSTEIFDRGLLFMVSLALREMDGNPDHHYFRI